MIAATDVMSCEVPAADIAAGGAAMAEEADHALRNKLNFDMTVFTCRVGVQTNLSVDEDEDDEEEEEAGTIAVSGAPLPSNALASA